VSQIFKARYRVYYEDTDAGGVVYHANYLKFMERARTDWLRSVGFDIAKLAARENLLFAVHKVNMEYHWPAGLNQLLTACVEVKAVKGASLELIQHILLRKKLICSATIKLACLERRNFRPRAMPNELRKELNTWITP
jgi:acyl-CoA thioester hydrolase